jgi:hypothetical protein
LKPAAVVIVATAKAVAYHGGFTPEGGLGNLAKHIENIRAFGLEPVLWQSAYFRPHNQSEDVKGLYLVGAGTHPGAGVPGVLSSAKVLDRVVPDPQ